MRIGMVGLGRMGTGMTRRLLRAGHEVVATDLDAEAVRALADEGATAARGLEELVDRLRPPRVVWLMLPAAATGTVAEQVGDLLDRGDVLVDGGNSHWRDAVDRADALGARGVHALDVGVSGGVWGLEQGYCLMVGGEPEAVDLLAPVLTALAPGSDAAPRTPGRSGDPSPAELGWVSCGPAGAGHFVKMVHNGIEYGVMAAYAEGLGLLAAANQGDRPVDAETAPLRERRYYTYDLPLAEIAEAWRRGSVIRSWLLDLTAGALLDAEELDGYEGRVSDSGEGRWTVQAGIDVGMPVPVIATALFDRFASRDRDDFANRALSAMRAAFGGHDEVRRGGLSAG